MSSHEAFGVLFKRSKAHGMKSMAQVHLGYVHLHYDSLTAHNLGMRRTGVVFSPLIFHMSVVGVT